MQVLQKRRSEQRQARGRRESGKRAQGNWGAKESDMGSSMGREGQGKQGKQWHGESELIGMHARAQNRQVAGLGINGA